MKTTNDYKIWENPNKLEIKINSREKLEKWNWISTEKINYEKDWVTQNPWERIVRSTSNWIVAVMPVTSEWNVIFTEEIRIPLMSETCDGRVIWMPAGLIDQWENKKTATKREMQEEIWFESDNIEYVDSIASSEGMTDEEVDIFIALNCTKINKIIEWFKEVDWFILKHENWENINSIYSVPYKEVYDFMDMAKSEWMKKWGKIDCALNHFERKFKDLVFNK